MIESMIAVINTHTPEGERDYVAITSPEVAFSAGLIAEAILGVLKRPLGEGGQVVPDNFVANSAFAKFLAWIITTHGPDDAELQDEARRIGTGSVVVIDHRTPTPEGPVLPEDIVGAFKVENGTVGEYFASPNHRLLTEHGFFQLNDRLERCLVQELAALAAQRPKN